MAEEDTDEKPRKKGFSFLKIFLFVILPLLITSGTVTGLYLAGVFGAGESQAVSEDGGDGEEAAQNSDEEKGAEGPAIYVSLDPPFVVNFADSGNARFLQITVEVMTRDPKVEEHVKHNMPAIRNNLVMLFSSQTTDSVSSLEGKEALREETLTSIQDILETETGDPGIEAVYFTSFVMQ